MRKVEGRLCPGSDEGLIVHRANDDLGRDLSGEQGIHVGCAGPCGLGEVPGDHMASGYLAPDAVRTFSRPSSSEEATLILRTSRTASSMRT